MRLAQAGDEREPGGGFVVVGDVLFDDAAVGGVGFGEVGVAAVVVEDRAEEIVVVLAEGVEAGLEGVARDRRGDRSLRAAVGRGAIGGGGYGGVVGVRIRSRPCCSGRTARPEARWTELKVCSQEKVTMASVSCWPSRRPLESNCWFSKSLGLGS